MLGIDAGTTAVKTLVMDLHGHVLGMARSAVEVRRPAARCAEQDMDAVWRAVVSTVSEALTKAGEVTVTGIGVTGQGDGAWLVDEAGEPVGPALLWLDGRASERVSAWMADGRADLVRAVTGSVLFSGALPVLLEELEAEQPETLARAAWHLNCKDWIRYRLTGVIATDATEASRTYLDTATGAYSDRLLAGLGQQHLARLLPPLLPATAVAGLVTPEAAGILGMSPGVPVATGMVDTPAGGVGLGITTPGDAYAIIGTTAFVGAIQDQRTLEESVPAITLSMGTDGQVVECLAPMNGTPNLDWAREVTGQAGCSWPDVERLVLDAGPGAGGVIFLPYGADSGERAPFLDTAASAAWLGLSVRSTAGQMLRAVYEGIAHSLRECMDVLSVAPGTTVGICGGAAVSDVVCQVLADVTDRRVERSSSEELGARGAGVLALVAAEHACDVDAALALVRQETRFFVPDPAHRALHADQAATFRRLRDAVRPEWPALRALQSAASTSTPTLTDDLETA